MVLSLPKWLAAGVVAVVVAIPFSLSAEAQYLVTSFENQGDLFTPLTTPPPAGTPAVALSQQYGVTQGTNSMEVVPTGYTWEWLTKNFGPETYAEWYGHQTLAFDYTRVTTAAGNYELIGSINAPTTGTSGWNEKQLVNWAWTNGGQNTTRTLTWDYGNILATSPSPGSGTSADFWQLGFVARTNPTYAPQNAYIDNIRFINPVTPQEYVWAGNGSTAGGTGYWSTVFQDATWLVNGQGSGVEWDSYKKAVFRSAGGTVSVSGTVVARNGIQFDTNGVTIVSDTNPAFTGRVELAGASPARNPIGVTAGASANVDLPLIGSNGFSKTGAGTLVLGGVSTVTGSAVISAGKLLDTSGRSLPDATIVVATGGTYETPAGVAVESTELRLAGGTLAVPKLNVTTGNSPGFLVNSFETQADLYEVNPASGMRDIVLSSSNGVSQGVSSMQATITNGSDYQWSFKSYDAATYDEWMTYKQIALDIVQVGGTSGNNFSGNMAVSGSGVNGSDGWAQTGNSQYPRFVFYSWATSGQTIQKTYTWDYSTVRANSAATGDGLGINLSFALGGGGAGDQTVYFDNLRFVDPVIPDAVGISTFVVESGTIAGTPDLAVFNGGRMTMPSDRQLAIAVKTLSVTETNEEPSGGGRIDLGAGRINVAAAGITGGELVADIIAGRGDGSWSGSTGITSSLAAANVAASIPRAVGWLDDGSGALTVAYSAPGDSNIDLQVDILDAANFFASGKFDSGALATWYEGDFGYDGLVDILDAADFLSTGLFDAGSYLSLPSGQDAGSIAAVPEPNATAAAGVLLLLAGLHAARRPRGFSQVR